jgi:uncharacterized membrane protein YfcA
MLGALLLARYNLKQGRGDRKGAFRLALFIMVLGGVAYLTSLHVPDIVTELGIFLTLLSQQLLVACITWLIYIGLEPFVRRRWPNLIISWNRPAGG